MLCTKRCFLAEQKKNVFFSFHFVSGWKFIFLLFLWLFFSHFLPRHFFFYQAERIPLCIFFTPKLITDTKLFKSHLVNVRFGAYNQIWMVQEMKQKINTLSHNKIVNISNSNSNSGKSAPFLRFRTDHAVFDLFCQKRIVNFFTYFIELKISP